MIRVLGRHKIKVSGKRHGGSPSRDEPYLENPELWSEAFWEIAVLARSLMLSLRPNIGGSR